MYIFAPVGSSDRIRFNHPDHRAAHISTDCDRTRADKTAARSRLPIMICFYNSRFPIGQGGVPITDQDSWWGSGHCKATLSALRLSL